VNKMINIINVDGSLELYKSKKISLEEMQKIVGGYIEFVYMPHDKVLIIDEDGIEKQLPVNAVASSLYQQFTTRNGIIVGRVIFADSNEID